MEYSLFYIYYRTNSYHLDDKYFLRKNFIKNTIIGKYFDLSAPCFSTSHDHKVARILANEKLKTYMEAELLAIENKDVLAIKGLDNDTYNWTGTRTSAVELVYSLIASGSINNGNTETKKLMEYFGKVFNVDLHDYARIYYDIKNRKIPSKGLNYLKSSLDLKINKEI
ncbi:MAG: RteC domain-containing protein [Prolixibacteraceae bacterium]